MKRRYSQCTSSERRGEEEGKGRRWLGASGKEEQGLKGIVERTHPRASVTKTASLVLSYFISFVSATPGYRRNPSYEPKRLGVKAWRFLPLFDERETRRNICIRCFQSPEDLRRFSFACPLRFPFTHVSLPVLFLAVRKTREEMEMERWGTKEGRAWGLLLLGGI